MKLRFWGFIKSQKIKILIWRKFFAVQINSNRFNTGSITWSFFVVELITVFLPSFRINKWATTAVTQLLSTTIFCHQHRVLNFYSWFKSWNFKIYLGISLFTKLLFLFMPGNVFWWQPSWALQIVLNMPRGICLGKLDLERSITHKQIVYLLFSNICCK